MSDTYDDIINLPHPNPTIRPRMSIANRAAQFAPFAALSGYDSAVKETARLTDQEVMLDENRLAVLNDKLRILTDRLLEQPEVTITYFQPDSKKSGGAYVSVTGTVKKVDDFEGALILTSGEKIMFDHISEIESELL